MQYCPASDHVCYVAVQKNVKDACFDTIRQGKRFCIGPNNSNVQKKCEYEAATISKCHIMDMMAKNKNCAPNDRECRKSIQRWEPFLS